MLGLAVPGWGRTRPQAARPDDGTWVESPQKKFERLLYETGIPIGLIFQETAIRLVYRPESQQSGYITFPLEAMLKPAGRLACTALKALLNHQRIHVSADPAAAAHILAESRKYQNEVSTQLAEQVLAALFELIKGFEAADEESRGRLLAGLRDRADRTHEIYEGLLTVLMRLVFLLYAEERETFPSDDLFVRTTRSPGCLRGSSRTRAPSRHDGPALRGLGPPDQPVPAGPRRGAYESDSDGKLVNDPGAARRPFDPPLFPFLEGRPASEPGGRAPVLPRVADGTVLRVLRNLLYLGQERLSYRSLEVEQIGSVYEAVMGYRVEAATRPVGRDQARKAPGAPVTISLDELLGAIGQQPGQVVQGEHRPQAGDGRRLGRPEAKTEADLVASLDKLIDGGSPRLPCRQGRWSSSPAPSGGGPGRTTRRRRSPGRS